MLAGMFTADATDEVVFLRHLRIWFVIRCVIHGSGLRRGLHQRFLRFNGHVNQDKVFGRI